MKKTIYILISILVVVYIALSVLGSGGEYAAEKIFYRAMKMSARITANPDVVPPKLLEYVESNFKNILEKYPKTEAARAANITLAEFYIYNKRYGDALSRLDLIIKANSKMPGVLSTAHFLKGRAYEKQNKWPNALKEYNIVRDDYTDTELGIKMPLYVARHYTDKGMDADARQAYGEAALFYKKLERDNNKSMLGYVASVLLIQAYMGAENYEESGTALEETIDKYGNGTTLAQLLPQVENIFVNKLKQPERAIKIYKDVMEKTKNGRLKKVLEEKIGQLVHKKVS
jgi:tetratricopeptide (TPR) repeat protein